MAAISACMALATTTVLLSGWRLILSSTAGLPWAVTTADPAQYADDDLFGFMKAAERGENQATTLRDSPFMVGTFLAVEPVRMTEDFGVMSRGVRDPVLHGHEFYTADLAAPFLPDAPPATT